MDRGDGIVRWSPSSTRDEFVSININYRVLERHRAIGHAVPELFEQLSISKHSDVPQPTAFDWSPRISGLVAIGTKGGEVHLLRIDDDSSDDIVLPLKLQRSCQAVSFNTTGLLAVGLDRVRNDQCLQIWDISQQLSKWDPSKKGWQTSSMTGFEPIHKLEASVAVSSIKFFEDQPKTLVVGIKNSSVRIHDLRDPNSAVITFPTKCNNNLTIDHADSNYFASSGLDSPTVMMWDRRASSRTLCSKMYLESVDAQELPFGAALKINKAIDEQQGVYIRSLRFYREKRGHLGVLSNAGELQIYKTEQEYVDHSPENDVEGSPELLSVRNSHTLRYPWFDPSFGYPVDDRVVSFDWVTLGSADFQSRVVTRDCKQSIRVKLVPSVTQHTAFDLIDFGGLSRFSQYFKFPHFGDSKETSSTLRDVAMVEARRNAAFLGPSIAIGSSTGTLKHPGSGMSNDDFEANISGWHRISEVDDTVTEEPELEKELSNDAEGLSLTDSRPMSSREQHELSHWKSLQFGSDVKGAYNKLNKRIRSRAQKGYLFDCKKNKELVAEDPWLGDVWVWIEGAEESALDDGMLSGHLDLKYLGVHTMWNNDLGKKFESRLVDTQILPNSSEWERAIENINKKHQRDRFEGLKTRKPHHRQLCLAICGWGKSPSELDSDLSELESKGQYTKAAIWALCEQAPQKAVEILKRGGKDFLFIALALDFYIKGAKSVDKVDWDEILQTYPQMRNDAYLRAIYALISTGDWKAIADETSLPLRDRVGIALRNFDDAQLSDWLDTQMDTAIATGDIEGIVLSGITDSLVDTLAEYIRRSGDYQTATLILAHAAPLYIDDYRVAQWRAQYISFLNATRLHILKSRFVVQSTRKSVDRDGIAVLKPRGRQVTLRCVACDSNLTNDAQNTANPPGEKKAVATHGGPTSHASSSSAPSSESRNPLYPTGVYAGIQCPRCGRHLPRCAVCLMTLGMPGADSLKGSIGDWAGREREKGEKGKNGGGGIDLMGNFLTFCMKCDHGFHAGHARSWFERHDECAVSGCRCKCNRGEVLGRGGWGGGGGGGGGGDGGDVGEG